MNLVSLPIANIPEYISPTAYKIFNQCNFKYYYTYLTGERFRSAQTEAMAVGSLFDSFVKANIAKDLNWFNKDTTLSLENLIKGSTEEHNKHLIPEGKRLFEFYKSSGAYSDLLTEQPTAVELESFKLIKDSQFSTGIPIFGKPDLKLQNSRITDWKVNGFGSKSGQSPKQGYCRLYDGTKGRLGPHKNVWMTMDLVDIDWAIQLTIYNWIEHSEPIIEFKEIDVGIEQIVIRDNIPRVASFRNKISADFQRSLYLDLQVMWTCIQKAKFDKPIASKDRCFAYNRQCEYSDKCPAFKDTFSGDPIFAQIMGIKNQ